MNNNNNRRSLYFVFSLNRDALLFAQQWSTSLYIGTWARKEKLEFIPTNGIMHLLVCEYCAIHIVLGLLLYYVYSMHILIRKLECSGFYNVGLAIFNWLCIMTFPMLGIILSFSSLGLSRRYWESMSAGCY